MANTILKDSCSLYARSIKNNAMKFFYDASEVLHFLFDTDKIHYTPKHHDRVKCYDVRYDDNRMKKLMGISDFSLNLVTKNLQLGYSFIGVLHHDIKNYINDSCLLIKNYEKFALPTFVHSVWVTNPYNPTDFFSNKFNLNRALKNTEVFRSCGTNWQYVFWVIGRDYLKNATYFAEQYNSKNVTIVEFESRNFITVNSMVGYSLKNLMSYAVIYKDTPVKNTYLSMISDIIRYSVLSKYGGVYIDIDYIITRNIDYLTQQVNFICGGLRMSDPYLISSSFVASTPGHIVSLKASEEINTNIKLITEGFYLQKLMNALLNKNDMLFINKKNYLEHPELFFNCILTYAIDYIAGPAVLSKTFFSLLPILDKSNVYFQAGVLHELTGLEIFLNTKLLASNSFDKDHIQYYIGQVGYDISFSEWYAIYFENNIQYVDYDNLLINNYSFCHTFANSSIDLKIECFNKELYHSLGSVGITNEYIKKSISKNFLSYDQVKIPNILHMHWSTKDQNSGDISQKNLKNILGNVRQLNTWQIYMWTNVKTKNLAEISYLESINVTIVDYLSLAKKYKFYVFIFQALEYGSFSLLSDIVRYIVLHEYGGLYLDLDVQLMNYQFLSKIQYTSDFYAGQLFSKNTEESSYVGGSVIGSISHHPMVHKIIQTINDNLSSNIKKDHSSYLQYFEYIDREIFFNDHCVIQGILLNAGPLVLSDIYYQYSNTFNTLIDTLFPEQIFHFDEIFHNFYTNKNVSIIVNNEVITFPPIFQETIEGSWTKYCMHKVDNSILYFENNYSNQLPFFLEESI